VFHLRIKIRTERPSNLLKRTLVECEKGHCLLEICFPKSFQGMAEIPQAQADMVG
jgi:hypothetical protein